MSTYLQITSGSGPAECRLAVAGIVQKLQAEAVSQDLDIDLSPVPDRKGNRHINIALHGPLAQAFADQWCGSLLWRCKSPLRPNSKRANWFVAGMLLPAPPCAAPAFDVRAVRYETFRAGGPGGQHQNTTDSAVRAIWQNLRITVRDQRSQHQNKAEALKRLQMLVALDARANEAETVAATHQRHSLLQRGNARRVFKGPKFEEVL